MAPRKEISVCCRAQVIALREVGLTYRDIAAKLHFSKTGVERIVQKYKETGALVNRSGRGKKKYTTLQEDKQIVLISKRDRRKTASQIREEFNATRSKDSAVSLTLIKDRLNESGLYGRIAAKKPLLRTVNKMKRLNWAKKHRDWTPEKWKTVLFSDESKFELFGGKRRVYVRRMKGERMKLQCLVPTVKHGGGSVMVWGCFGNEKTGDLIKIDGILRKESYHKILMKHALPSGKRLIEGKFVFQQDNDPKHKSKLCINYLRKKEEEGFFECMDWPPQSPDCNPIELLWDELDRSVRKLQPKNSEQLWSYLQTIWKSISTETLQKLIERMPKICRAVIKEKGGYFEESKI
ncbi:paired box protein and transposase domain containing protein [Lasius niger]|uniref:Paired box protein and transposase domain containing protein n=1 Tax=Lasius niger TaxID=67767 RepID=A0A0J7JYS7_LASNI|nr:paired box protein and transposase domain containing protein [Lasius niger]